MIPRRDFLKSCGICLVSTKLILPTKLIVPTEPEPEPEPEPKSGLVRLPIHKLICKGRVINCSDCYNHNFEMSMAKFWQVNPILTIAHGSYYMVIDGFYRVHAAKNLGWTTMWCLVVAKDVL